MATATPRLAPTMALVKAGRFFSVVKDSDPDCEEYVWEVIDADGEVVDSQDTMHRALVAAAELEAEVEDEERAERLSDLRGEIALAAEDVEDEATLAAVLALLRK